MIKNGKTIALAIALAIATGVTTGLVGCASTPKQESAGQYIDSSAITAKVKANLVADSEISSLPISVETYKGNVQLSGFVKSYEQKRRAVQAAQSVPGVVSVKDSLVVRTNLDGK